MNAICVLAEKNTWVRRLPELQGSCKALRVRTVEAEWPRGGEAIDYRSDIPETGAIVLHRIPGGWALAQANTSSRCPTGS